MSATTVTSFEINSSLKARLQRRESFLSGESALLLLPSQERGTEQFYARTDNGARRVGREVGLNVEYLDGPDFPGALNEFSATVAMLNFAIALGPNLAAALIYDTARFLIRKIRLRHHRSDPADDRLVLRVARLEQTEHGMAIQGLEITGSADAVVEQFMRTLIALPDPARIREILQENHPEPEDD